MTRARIKKKEGEEEENKKIKKINRLDQQLPNLLCCCQLQLPGTLHCVSPPLKLPALPSLTVTNKTPITHFFSGGGGGREKGGVKKRKRKENHMNKHSRD